MFDLIEKLTKTAVSVATLPVSVAIDVVSIPLIADDQRESSTAKNLSAIVGNVEDLAAGKWKDKDK